MRSDDISAINYIAGGHVYELRLDNGWHLSDLTALAGAPATASAIYAPRGYVRSDGISAVVYSTSDNRIHELRLDNGWKYFDLTSIPNAGPGSARVGYIRADGISAVVYRGQDGHIQEIRLESDGWHWADLTNLAGAPLAASSPWPYNRSGLPTDYLPMVLR